MNDPLDILLRIAFTLLLLMLWAIVIGSALSLFHFLLSLPLRRAERARTILDLMETALQHGEPVEQAFISISQSREQSLGVRFHLFVAWLERGLRLNEAFAKVPSLLPPTIVAMFQAGERIGDLRKVLPACRQLLTDAVSETRSALNYLVVITFVVSPMTIFVFSMTAILVFPKFIEISYGMNVGQPAAIRWLIDYRVPFIWIQILLQLAVWSAAFVYVMGPHTRRWLPGYDRLSWRLPWRRKRMQRDFSVMLATLLDAGMPESEAVALAASCTANSVFESRAVGVTDALQQGRSLTEAVQTLDDTEEFRWRLTNATHSRGGFRAALAGWHDALNAKSFQHEQAAAHLISTGLVLFNGLFVAAVVISVFSFLISIVNAGTPMVIPLNNRSRPRHSRETAALMTELMIGIAILGIAVIPLAYSFAQEHKYLRICYQRAVAMEIVDGQMEVLLAGDWRSFTNGVHSLTSRAQSATNLPPGILQLTVANKNLRLEWLPQGRGQGGKIIREATAK